MAGREDGLAVGAESDGANFAGMRQRLTDRLTLRHIPDARPEPETAGDRELAVRAEGHGQDAALVRQHGAELVDVAPIKGQIHPDRVS